MRIKRIGLALGALWLGMAALAAEPVEVFKAVSGLPCTQMEQDLATLQAVGGGTYSLAISGRVGQYQDLQAQLDQLRFVDVPYKGEDLSPLALETPTGLRDEYRNVPRQVADPQIGFGIAELGLGGIFGYATYLSLSDPNTDTKTVVGLSLLTILAGGASIAAFSHTKTVYDRKFDAQAAATNDRIRADVQQQNAAIKQKNALRQQQLSEREAAVAQNQKIANERQAIVAKMTAFEQKSGELALTRIKSLTSATNRRCLDKLVYEGAAVRLGNADAFVYLIVRPLNPSGDPLQDAPQIDGLHFGVSSIRLADPLGTVADVTNPPVAGTIMASQAPLPVVVPSGSVAVELKLALQGQVAVPDQLKVDASIEAHQDGVVFQTQGQGKIRVLP